MIFPEHCKYVGSASTRPCGNRVYFLSRYLLRETPDGTELVEVTLDPAGKGMMRKIVSSRVLASPDQVYCFPDRVQIHDRTRLVHLAGESGYRCTVFTSLEENRTFVLDPDLSGLLTVHVYDVIPPRPTLSACLKELEADGLFGELSVQFDHHIRDISTVPADVYPCRAAGYTRTLDADPMHGGERVAGCLTGSQFYTECYGKNFTLENICPLEQVNDEPFIARCCRAEREGIGTWNGKFGAIVHWGAGPAMIARSVNELVTRWRAK
ncbi:hypothetical protein [Methanoregula sp.]|uniref:DUF7714 family protein n=1 Tax=Methanoregula sp. TaxID=2052170 RepID=UPI0023692267|nr:hypothetical protein [Methanoregula sp.]MDD1686667.1 hypothetical protein [Methanoregula sp.]